MSYLRLNAVLFSFLFKLKKVGWHFALAIAYLLLILSLFLLDLPLRLLSVLGNQLDHLAVHFSEEISGLKALALDQLASFLVYLLVSQLFHCNFSWNILKSRHFKGHFSVFVQNYKSRLTFNLLLNHSFANIHFVLLDDSLHCLLIGPFPVGCLRIDPRFVLVNQYTSLFIRVQHVDAVEVTFAFPQFI